MESQEKTNRRAAASWCLYDFANSAFNTVIITFVFSVYFGRAVIGDETQGAAYWGYAISASSFVVAILGPILGSATDYSGRHKRPLLLATLACVLATCGLWFAVPDMSGIGVLMILALLAFANIAFELGQVFYNAMLPNIAPSSHTGRISGWAWGLGYFGGLLCLAMVLWGLVGLGDVPPALGLTKDDGINVRAVAICVALWYLLFSLPVFLFTPTETNRVVSMRRATIEGWANIKKLVSEIKGHKNFVRFLIASALYRDGLVTLFAVGGIYAADVYDMEFDEILIFAIGLNVTAGLGAFAFSFIDDKAGSKKTVMIALTGLVLVGVLILMTDSKMVFMGLSLLLGIFIGPAQAASRTLAARLSVPGTEGQNFGLYAMTGKSVAFLGPLGFALATDIFDTQKAGLFVILLFWLVGFIILRKVREQ